MLKNEKKISSEAVVKWLETDTGKGGLIKFFKDISNKKMKNKIRNIDNNLLKELPFGKHTIIIEIESRGATESKSGEDSNKFKDIMIQTVVDKDGNNKNIQNIVIIDKKGVVKWHKLETPIKINEQNNIPVVEETELIKQIQRKQYLVLQIEFDLVKEKYGQFITDAEIFVGGRKNKSKSKKKGRKRNNKTKKKSKSKK